MSQQVPPQPTTDPKKDYLDFIKEFFEALKAFFKKHKDEEENKVFQQKIEEVQKKLEQVDAQDEIELDCLRDVAETLKAVQTKAGVIEGGKIEDSSPMDWAAAVESLKVFEEKLPDMQYSISSDRIEEVLSKALNDKDIMDKIYITGENGNRILSPDVKMFVSSNGEKIDLYLKIGLQTLKINNIISEKDASGNLHEKIVAEKSSIYHKDGNYYLTTDSNATLPLQEFKLSADMSIEKNITQSWLYTKKLDVIEQVKKASEAEQKLLAVSGTPDRPFAKDNFHCILDERGYSIKDRETDSMLTLKFDRETGSINAMFSKVKGFTSVGDPKQVMLFTPVIGSENGAIRYWFSQDMKPDENKNVNKLLNSEFITTFLESKGFSSEKYLEIRHRADPVSEMTRVSTPEFRKVELLKNTLDDYFMNNKGFEHYKVQLDGYNGVNVQLSIVTPDNSKYIIDFDDKGNIANQKWAKRTLDGSEPEPVKVVGRIANNDVVVRREIFKSPEFAICYDSVKKAVNEIADKVTGKGISYGTSMTSGNEQTRRAVEKERFIDSASVLAAEAIKAKNFHGNLDAKTLRDMISDEIEHQTGRYPSAEYRQALEDNTFIIASKLSELGYIDNAYTMSTPRENRPYTPETFVSEGIIEHESVAEPVVEEAKPLNVINVNDLPQEVRNAFADDFDAQTVTPKSDVTNEGVKSNPESKTATQTEQTGKKVKPQRVNVNR